MDADGWIPVELLASFRRVRIHTGAVNTQLIVEVSELTSLLLSSGGNIFKKSLRLSHDLSET